MTALQFLGDVQRLAETWLRLCAEPHGFEAEKILAAYPELAETLDRLDTVCERSFPAYSAATREVLK